MPSEFWLNEKAHELLAVAEATYGARDLSYSFLGVSFDDDGPNIRFTVGCDGLWTELNTGVLQDGREDQALYQIAHEVIHVLAPNQKTPTLMIEEALATWFSIHAPIFNWHGYRRAAIDHLTGNYRDAYVLFQELISRAPDAIVQLRAVRRNFFDMDEQFFLQMLPTVDASLASKLAERRVMR